MSRKVSTAVADPMLPITPISIEGKTYKMTLDIASLAEAESALIAEGHRDVNLLFMLPNQNLHNTRIIFAASLRKHHPELSFETAQKLVTFGNLYDIASKIMEAWTAATPEKPANPPEPVE